jgi:hypothetical protein
MGLNYIDPNGGVDLAAPGPIGGTTPSTGAFTILTAAPPANTSGLVVSGYSLTESNAQSLVDLAGTWNTSGAPTALKVNITDTASNAASLLMQLQVGGTNKFRVKKSGTVGISDSDGGPSLRANGLFLENVNFLETAYRPARFAYLSLGGETGADDCTLFPVTAATLQMGLLHATTPTGQTLKAHDVTTGTGASLTLKGGDGSVANGEVILGSGAVRVLDTNVGFFNTSPVSQPTGFAVASTGIGVVGTDLVDQAAIDGYLNEFGAKLNTIRDALNALGLTTIV